MRIYLDHNAGAPLRPAGARGARRLHGPGARQSRLGPSGRPARPPRDGGVARHGRRVDRRCRPSGRIHQWRHGIQQSGDFRSPGRIARSPPNRHLGDRALVDSGAAGRPERDGFEIVRVAPDRDGLIPLSAVIDALDDRTALVTLALANAEVGTVQTSRRSPGRSPGGRGVPCRCGPGGRPDGGGCGRASAAI